MENSKTTLTKVTIEIDISEPSEGTSFLETLQREGFDRRVLTVNMPKVKIEGTFPGSLEDCRIRCQKLNKKCKVSAQ